LVASGCSTKQQPALACALLADGRLSARYAQYLSPPGLVKTARRGIEQRALAIG
jgi:hypothetical protein